MYYAVYKGYETGIFNTWDECCENVKGYKNAKYKKFTKLDEAKEFVKFGFIMPDDENHDLTKPEVYDENVINVYTDGSCINNGKSDAKAGIGIFFSDDDERNVSRKVIGKQTNNVAELTAIKTVYYILKNEIKSNKNIRIYSDSKYAINCCTDYGKKHERKMWKEDIPNLELVKEIYLLYKNLKNVDFIHVKAHTNKVDIHSYGNKQADFLANKCLI